MTFYDSCKYTFQMPVNADDTKRDELILDLVKRRYDSELQRINDLDGKANNMTGFVSVVITLLIGTGTFGVLGKIANLEYYIPYFIGIELLIISFLYSLSAIRIRRWEYVPKAETLTTQYLTLHPRVVTRKVLVTMAESIASMKQQNEQKANGINMGWYFLIAGLAFIVLFTIVLALGGYLVCPVKGTGG
jgi:hypothetical protein